MAIEKRPITSRAEWLGWRTAFLGASEIGAVAGVDQYRTALSVFAEKAGLIQNTPDNAPMRRGRWLEHAAFAAMQEEDPGRRFVQPGVFIMDHDLGLAATPDALTESDEGGLVNVQIKCSSPGVFESWDDVPPLNYQLQTLAEGMLLDSATNYLAVFVVDSYSAKLEWFEIPRHADAEEKIRDLTRNFWDELKEGRMPAPDYGRDRDTIRSLYRPRPDVPSPLDLHLDNRIYDLLEDREAAKNMIKQAEEACEKAEAEIVRKLDGAERAVATGWAISNKLIRTKEYTVTVAAKEYPRLTVKRLRGPANV